MLTFIVPNSNSVNHNKNNPLVSHINCWKMNPQINKIKTYKQKNCTRDVHGKPICKGDLASHFFLLSNLYVGLLKKH